MTRIIAAIATVLALLFVAAPAEAAPSKDVTYSYVNVQLSNDGGVTYDTYAIAGYVRYSRDGTAKTYCDYGKYTGKPISQSVFDGRYVVDYAIANTTSAGVKEHCITNFLNRVYA